VVVLGAMSSEVVYADLDELYVDELPEDPTTLVQRGKQMPRVYGFDKLYGTARNRFSHVYTRTFKSIEQFKLGLFPKPKAGENTEYRDGIHQDNHNFALFIASMREDLGAMKFALVQKKRLSCDGWLSPVDQVDDGSHVEYTKNWQDRTKFGATALHAAAASAKLKAVRLLCEHGWDPQFLNYKKEVPMDVIPKERQLAGAVYKCLRSFKKKRRWRNKKVEKKGKAELKFNKGEKHPSRWLAEMKLDPHGNYKYARD
jgi:hypothetical protein